MSVIGHGVEVVPSSLQRPSSPPDGSLIYQSDINQLLVWNGTVWGPLGAGSITTDSVAPSSPSSGDLWYDTNSGKTFVYYDDGSSAQWVEVGASSTLPNHASSHSRGGADVIDGDRLTVDYVPTNYTRNSAASGAGDNTDLTAHLSGIDNSLNTLFNNTICMTRGINTSQSIANGTSVALQFSTADLLDPEDMHSTSVNNTRFVFPTTGVYQVDGGWAINASTNIMWCALMVNNSIKAYNGTGSGSSQNGVAYISCSSLLYVNANDYVELHGYQTNGSSAARTPYSGYLNIIKVRNV